VSADQK